MSAIQTKKKKKKMRTKDKVMLTLSIIMIAIAVLALVAVWLMNSSLLDDKEGLHGEEFTNSYATNTQIKDKMVNFLVLGIDSDADDKKRHTNLTDVIMVVNYDVAAKKVNVLQIPRDTYMDDKYPTGKTHKINAIYNRPKSTKGGGLNGLTTAIYENFKITIDHYVTITMDGFRDVVDALGGLDIYSAHTFTSVDGYHYKKGVQHMNGKQAINFVRERKNVPGGDTGRQRNQREFWSSLMDRLLSASAGELAKTVPSLVNIVRTDLTPAECLDFVKSVQGLDKSDIVFHLVPGKYGSYKGYSVFSANKEATAEVLNTYFRPYEDDVPASELGIVQLFDGVTIKDDPQAIGGTTSK